nr:hypothetical protein [Tanacetum cinerariifolium]
EATEPLVYLGFFLATKDETSEILKNFIKEIENLVDKNVKIIRCNNMTEHKNKVMDDFCKEKGIKWEYSVARTPQQNRAEAVSTTCYVQNSVLIVKPYNKTPYELFRGFKPALSFMRPFECHVTILITLDNLGKFDGKSDKGFFVGYSLSSKAFRVYNTRTMKVEENLHIEFLENKPMIERNGPKWLFDIDSLPQSMNYVSVAPSTILDESASTQGDLNAGTSLGKEATSQDYIVMPIWKDASYFDSSSKDVKDGQIYVDDIIFRSTNKELCTAFEKLMKDKFQMSSMRELTLFLGLQVTQKKDGIFNSQDKYVHKILKKFNYSDVKSASTPIDLENPLVKDGDANDIDVHLYRSMIRSLMYLIASKPDIMFAVCACARF